MNIFDVSIETLDIPDLYKDYNDIDPLVEILDTNEKYISNHKKNVENYEIDKLNWFSEMDTYRGLIIILNNKKSREELVQYIQNRNSREKLISKKEEDNIIEEIRKNQIQELPDYEPLQLLK